MDVIETKRSEFEHPTQSPEAAESFEVRREATVGRDMENRELAGFQPMEKPLPLQGDIAPIQVPVEMSHREMDPAKAIESLNRVLRGELNVTAANASEMMDVANNLGRGEQIPLQ